MSSLISRLRQILHSAWLPAVAVTLVSACVLLAVSCEVAGQRARAHESAQMNARGQRFLERLEQVFGQLREGVDHLQAVRERTCDPAMLAALREVGLSYRFVYEAAFVDHASACSSRGGREVLRPGRDPDIHGPVYSYWLNTTAEPNDNLAALVLGRGSFLVSTSRGHLSDAVDLPAGGSLLVVLDGGRRAIPVLGPSHPWPPAPDWPPASDRALLEFSDRLVYRMPTQYRDYQLMLIAPRRSLALPGNTLLWGMIGASLFLASALGAASLRLTRYRRSLAFKLRKALHRGELQVLYQPIFTLLERRCVGAEALVRWRRGDGSLTSPELFIPLAEDTGQIRQITDFVLQRVLQQLAPLLRAHPRLYVSINLAACDVTQPRIGGVAARLLALHRLPARQIAFEVTERSLVDVDAARETLQALRAAGHQILIDDFGTGYSSLSYLQTLPVDGLKIDKAFIEVLDRQAIDNAIAPHIIRMAHDLHLQVIAEGIESQEQAMLLAREGVSYGQGWLFAHPLSAQAFGELIERGAKVPGR